MNDSKTIDSLASLTRSLGVAALVVAAAGCSADVGDSGYDVADFTSLEELYEAADALVTPEEIPADEIEDEVGSYDEQTLALLAEQGIDPEVAARDTLAARERGDVAQMLLLRTDVTFRAGIGCKGKMAEFVGSTGNDIILTGGGAQVIHGRAGNDILSGGDGNDTICGGNGADQILGGAGKDTLVGQAGADIIVGGSQADTLEGGAGQDILQGTSVRGEQIPSGNQTLVYSGTFGAHANDDLKGGDGADTLWLSSGDTYNGGAGTGDRCVSTSGNTGQLVTNAGCES